MPAGGICLAAARVMRSIAFARVLTALCSNSIAIDLDVKLQTGSGAYRVGTAGGIGGGGVGVPFPSSMSIQFPLIQLQFHSCNWDPIPQFQFRIGTHAAILIPHWGPNINDWVPAIGWRLINCGVNYIRSQYQYDGRPVSDT